MSGYRSLHREQVLHDEGGVAIWSCQATSLLVSSASSSAEPDGGEQRWRIWTASSDGYVRAYTAQPTSMTDDTLNASALSLHCSHVLTGTHQQAPSPAAEGAEQQRPAAALGCSVVHILRNYSGEDQDSGDYVVASLEMAGTVRIWSFTADWDEKQQQPAAPEGDADSAAAAPAPPKPVKCLAEFTVQNATGTTLQLAPPRTITSVQEVVVAVGCLDGTIAIVATGISTANAAAAATTNQKEPSTAGTILE